MGGGVYEELFCTNSRLMARAQFSLTVLPQPHGGVDLTTLASVHGHPNIVPTQQNACSLKTVADQPGGCVNHVYMANTQLGRVENWNTEIINPVFGKRINYTGEINCI
jgi:hypothetical protein